MAETKKTTSTAKKTTSTAAKKTTTAKAAPVKKTETPKVETPKTEAPKAEPVKEVKTEKKVETKKVEKPAKPVVTEARAIARDVRVTPRKARLVIDLIRGKAVNEALGILANTNKAAAPIVAKVIKSAASNAINNFGMKEENLFVSEVWANDGIKMKRFLPRAKGSASGLVKRASTITVVVKER